MRFFEAIGGFFKSCWNVVRGLLIILGVLLVLSIVLNAFNVEVSILHDIAVWICNTFIGAFNWLLKYV